MAILAHVSFEDRSVGKELFRWRTSPAVWGRDDVERFARRMHSLVGREGGWHWRLETSSADPQLVVVGAKGTVRSGPLRLSKQVIEQVARGGEDPASLGRAGTEPRGVLVATASGSRRPHVTDVLRRHHEDHVLRDVRGVVADAFEVARHEDQRRATASIFAGSWSM